MRAALIRVERVTFLSFVLVAKTVTPRIVQKKLPFIKARTNAAVIATEESTSTPFIYLTQTEQCLPPNLSSSRAIGDSKTCNCDVIVLSYRQECLEEKPIHISYILVRESTWTSGRNILYFVARERMRAYHYYIFLDDDVDLGFKSFASQEMKKLVPFRVFEQWLLENEPAIGVGSYDKKCQDARFNWGRRRILCGINEPSMTVPTMWFDANFNAFHHKAVEHILPYPTQFDKESWWDSQLHVIYSAELIFRGQVLLFAPIQVHNYQHRKYPQTTRHYDAHVRTFVQEIQKRAPRAYQNHTLFKKVQSTPFKKYFLKTPTYCMNTTGYLIVPYSHFERESQLKAQD